MDHVSTSRRRPMIYRLEGRMGRNETWNGNIAVRVEGSIRMRDGEDAHEHSNRE
jgi:hypothetical protein